VRVGLIIYGSLDTISGGYLYDRILVEHLRRQGDYVEIISLPWRNYGRHLNDNFSTALYRRLCLISLDVLVQDELNHPSLFWLNQRLKKRVRYPIISFVHHLRCSEAHPAGENLFYRWIERRYLTSVAGFICNSQTTLTAVEALAGTGRQAIVAYPGGNRLRPSITPDQIVERACQPGPLRIIFVGSVIQRKRLHILLAGLADLPHRNWQLDVIGRITVDPIYVEFIRRQIRRAGLEPLVNLRGSLSDADLAIRLSHSHLLAVPSSYEGFGIVYLEGMGFGLPAIASTAGAAHEIITQGQNGFLVPPDDPETLTQHLQTLSQDRERLAQMSLAARQRYTAHPTWQESAERIRQFLISFCG
jgi:glycosyltransferase involved in cell wall biosynthesis